MHHKACSRQLLTSYEVRTSHCLKELVKALASRLAADFFLSALHGPCAQKTTINYKFKTHNQLKTRVRELALLQ